MRLQGLMQGEVVIGGCVKRLNFKRRKWFGISFHPFTSAACL
jgi:hypothetical protein